ncbi:MAG: N,N-dimethylformamidase beta subunit family domain-containing protein [Pirellulales bacterium]
MAGKHGSARQLSRRELLQATAGAGLATALPLLKAGAAVPAASRSNDLIRVENSKHGTTDWMLAKTILDANGKRSSRIEGFCSRTSLRAGETLDIRVSSRPDSPFLIDVYRLGYYQGKGGRHVTQLGPFRGRAQPEPEIGEQRLRECRWETSARLTIPHDWNSGIYVGKLTAEKDGAQSYVPYMGIADWTCRDESHWLYEGTDMKNGDTIPGLIGWEWNGSPADIPGLRVLASGDVNDGFGGEGTYHATVYPGKKGNWVFNASTWWWWDGLAIPPGHVRVTDRLKGPDPRVQRMTVNLDVEKLSTPVVAHVDDDRAAGRSPPIAHQRADRDSCADFVEFRLELISIHAVRDTNEVEKVRDIAVARVR